MIRATQSLTAHHSYIRDSGTRKLALQRALHFLGERWVFHPSRRIQRLSTPNVDADQREIACTA